MNKRCLTVLFACVASVSASANLAAFATETKPKYGPEATVLSQSHEYFRQSPAPDFWSLIPYYTAQMDETACSVATLTMVANGARAGAHLSSEDELVTQEGLVKKVKHSAWNRGLVAGQFAGYGVTLDQLSEVAREALTAYGIRVASIEMFRATELSDAFKAKVHQALLENEKSNQDFIIANFNQKVFTSDSEAGHVAPVGAYDAKNRRVLILDPDRKWYEPYWVSEETFLKGMATLDKRAGKNRGMLWIKLQK